MKKLLKKKYYYNTLLESFVKLSLKQLLFKVLFKNIQLESETLVIDDLYTLV